MNITLNRDFRAKGCVICIKKIPVLVTKKIKAIHKQLIYGQIQFWRHLIFISLTVNRVKMAENPTDNSYQHQGGYPDAPPSYDESMNAGAAGKLK